MQAYRHRNLVYFSIPKNGSSSYDNIFKQLGWEECSLPSVNWSIDKVFGYWRDPIERHTVGTVQALLKYNLTDLLDDPLLHKLITTSVFDLHSYPIVPSLGEDWAYRIEWIPLRGTVVNYKYMTSVELTEVILEKYGVNKKLSHFPTLNTASTEQTQLVEKFKKIKDSIPAIRDTIIYFYGKDLKLDRLITKYFNYSSMSANWEDLSWLSNYRIYEKNSS